MVEPRRRGPGVGSCVPDRPDARRPGTYVHCHGHARGEDRGHARREAEPCLTHHPCRRAGVHGAHDRRAPHGPRPGRGCSRRGSSVSERDPRRSSDRRFDYADFGPPIRVSGGIRARNQRGEIARTWWSRRFVDALEDYYGSDASRLARGRSYARAGQVIAIELSPGVVSASVQGSRPEPYAVRITVKELDDGAWSNVETAMAARAVFLARLLAGEMPDEIEEAFEAAKVRLFPARRGDLVTSCTCPDTANPCKHIAAVYYLLAESFDENPFLIFEWRGSPRGRLIAELGALRPSTSTGAARRPGPLKARAAAPGLDRRSVNGFWDGGSWPEVPI